MKHVERRHTLDGKKFHAMRRLIMNEASEEEAAKLTAYLALAHKRGG